MTTPTTPPTFPAPGCQIWGSRECQCKSSDPNFIDNIIKQVHDEEAELIMLRNLRDELGAAIANEGPHTIEHLMACSMLGKHTTVIGKKRYEQMTQQIAKLETELAEACEAGKKEYLRAEQWAKLHGQAVECMDREERRALAAEEKLTAALTAKEGAEREASETRAALTLTEREVSVVRQQIGATAKGAAARAGGWPKDTIHGYAGENANAWQFGWQWCNDCLADPEFIQPGSAQSESQSLRERLAAVEKTALHYADENMNSHFRIAAEAVLEVLKPQG